MTRERRPCVCRGAALEANRADPVDVEEAVRSHQRLLEHRSWVAREQLAGRLIVGAPTALAPFPIALRKVV
jgi:hypothetical protein